MHSSSHRQDRRASSYSSSGGRPSASRRGAPSRGHGSSSSSPSRPRSGGGNRFSHGDRRSSFGRGSRPGRKISTFDVSRYINRNPATHEPEAIYTPVHAFETFGIDRTLLTNIREAGITAPTAIQDQIIPLILKGRDVVGLSNTGTGKTAAFLIPIINATVQNRERRTLILAPTRELAIQVEQELRKLARGMKVFSTVCVGGTGIRPQIMQLKRLNHFIIGTPGRILDLINRRCINPGTFTTVILDEADRMLDMGFIHDIKQILKDTPKERETLFFSATMSPNIEKLIHDFLREPITVSVKKKEITANIEQDVVRHGDGDKLAVLASLLVREDFTRVIVFGAMKHSVEKLSVELNRHGITADSIHGNKSHPQRQRALKRFKESEVKVLVATDVAARGIHVDNVSHVINYDLPATYEDYVHRIGRTGRGVHRGKALTFVR